MINTVMPAGIKGEICKIPPSKLVMVMRNTPMAMRFRAVCCIGSGTEKRLMKNFIDWLSR
jgi:hypothetical protein